MATEDFYNKARKVEIFVHILSVATMGDFYRVERETSMVPVTLLVEWLAFV
jgi:hypothetical protein